MVLRVGDHGVGMPQSVDVSGMGLMIMKHRANLMGAQSNADSPAGNETPEICLMEAPRHAG